MIGFACPGDGAERHLGPTPDLVFAARATASFPGAFPPARISEIDDMLTGRGEDWPGRQAFIDRVLPGRPHPESVDLIDGAVLDNRPFGPALAALGHDAVLVLADGIRRAGGLPILISSNATAAQRATAFASAAVVMRLPGLCSSIAANTCRMCSRRWPFTLALVTVI